MADRITHKQLDRMVLALNRATGRPEQPYAKNDDTDRYEAQIGCLHISGAYGGWALHEIVSDGGGVRDVSGMGHQPARVLWTFLRGYAQAVRDVTDSRQSFPLA